MTMARSVALAAVTVMALAGCGGGGGGEESSGPATVRMPLGDLRNMLPMDSNEANSIETIDTLYSGLVRYDTETTEPYNYMAKDITSDDGVHWTIEIKEGWKFHNGEPVDAEAFARAWNYAAYGPNAMVNNYFFERFEGYEEMQEGEDGSEPKAKELSGLKVADDYTLEVTLNQRFGSFPTMLGYTGFFPVAEECLEDVDKCGREPIGNGPFKIAEPFKPETGVKVERWKGYKGDEKPSYDRIEWTSYVGDNESWPDFQAGDMDISEPPPEEWAAAQGDPELQQRMVQQDGTALTYLGFPLYSDNELYQNKDFRDAIAHAIDMKSIIDAVMPGRGKPATEWTVPEIIPGGEKGTCQTCEYDPKEAKRLLAKAGGWPKGEKLQIWYQTDPNTEAVFKAIGDQLKQNLGIDYKLNNLEKSDYFTKRSAHEFDGIFYNNWFPDYPLNENYLSPVYSGPEGNNNWGYQSDEFERLISEGDAETELDAAIAKYQEAERVIAEDRPSRPLYWSVRNVYYSENLDNVKLFPFSGGVVLRELKVDS